MDKLTCTAKLEGNEIIISNLKDNEIKIDISGDVDFTNIVSDLSEFIDKSPGIELVIENETTITEEKLNLIIDTLKNIFEKYNDSIKETEELEEENVEPF